MKEMLKIDGLQIGYKALKKKGKAVVLSQPIDTVVFEGELVALTGPNGAGKSTLFRTIAGMQQALNGSIEIDGKKLEALNLRQMSRLLSIVFTDQITDAYLRVYDIVAAGRYPYINQWMKMSDTDRKIILESLEKTGMIEFKDRLFSSLSDGEKQKVLISKALAQDTPLILLDEPAAFLDYPSKINLLKLLKQLCVEERKTIILSSHDLEMILRRVDKLWVMARNKPLAVGSPSSLLNSKTIDLYFGINHDF